MIQLAGQASAIIDYQSIDFQGSGTEILSDAAGRGLDVEVQGGPTFNSEQSVSGSDGAYSLSFDAAFSSKPQLDVILEDESIWFVSEWSTNSNGNYDGAILQFVDGANNTVNPTFSWSAHIAWVALS